MNYQQIVRALEDVPLFEDLPAAALELLARQVIPVRLEKDQVLFNQGDPGDSLYIILSGCASVVTSSQEAPGLIIDRYGPGEIVGELSMIDQEPRSASVVAAEQTDLLKLPRGAFLEVLLAQPALALGVLHSLTARLRFTAAYLQKAIEWAGNITRGDYRAAKSQMEAARREPTSSKSSAAGRQEEFLAAFIKMVEGVQDREETLKAQLHAFQIHIDEARRQEEVDNLLGSRFFQKLEETLRMRNAETGQDDLAGKDSPQNPGP